MVANREYTKEGLPVVSYGTVQSLLNPDDRTGGRTKQLIVWLEEISKENPEVGTFIDKLSEWEISKPEEITMFIMAATLVYKILKKQMESNKLAESMQRSSSFSLKKLLRKIQKWKNLLINKLIG